MSNKHKTRKKLGEAENNSKEKVTTGKAIASFLIAQVGLYFYITKKDESPKVAQTYGMLALASVGLTIASRILKK